MAGLVQTARAMRERLDHLIEELVCFENEVAWVRGTGSFDKRMEPKVEPKRVAVAGECTCLCVCSPMNPALWSALPIEVLQLVFARLPLPKIIQLRCLSREWNRSLTGGNPEFMRECAEARARTFALIPIRSKGRGLVSVTLFDTDSKRWYSFEHQMGEKKFVSTRAGDGGLVAAVSTAVDKEEHPFFITVFNPLTGQCRSLPLPPALSQVLPSMVQLVMDHDAKCYKVIVAGETRQRAGHATAIVAQIYCSETGVWRTAQSFTDLIFGLQNRLVDCDNGDYLALHGVPCVYDCAGRQLFEFDVTSNPFKAGAGTLREPFKSYAFVEDRLFVLHEEVFHEPPGSTYEFCVTEFQGQKDEPNWVKLGIHRCGEFGTRPHSLTRFNMQLYACKGLLLVKASNGEDSWGFRHELTWLYDMSKAEWRAIPGIPSANKSDYYDDDLYPVSTMFDLRWDAIP